MVAAVVEVGGGGGGGGWQVPKPSACSVHRVGMAGTFGALQTDMGWTGGGNGLRLEIFGREGGAKNTKAGRG